MELIKQAEAALAQWEMALAQSTSLGISIAGLKACGNLGTFILTVEQYRNHKRRMELIQTVDNYISRKLFDYVKAEGVDGWNMCHDFQYVPFIWSDTLEGLKDDVEELIEEQKKYIMEKVGRRT